MEPNFSGYVTKANLRCADGRTIMPGAFNGQNGMKVPLVYQHNHKDVSQVLGHVMLTAKDDGVWGDAFLNGSPKAIDAAFAVEHGDLDKFSIWAKDLDERGYMVHDGVIQEVSLCIAGQNPGANIANVLTHGDLADDEENLLVVGFELKHAAPAVEEKSSDSSSSERTVAEVLATLTPEQNNAVNMVLEDIVKEAVTEALTEEPAAQHSDIDSSEKGPNMTRNVFDQTDKPVELPQLKHDDMAAILTRAREGKVDSLRDLVRSDHGKELMHANTYGVENVEVLFPDAQALMRTPTFVDRRQEWVKAFMAGTSHSPFSRVKTVYADITADEARARGYIKANEKVEEVFPVFRRTTGPAMVYKKQKLDRQDIIDVTDFDIVAWMKVEMRGKLDEEIARAGLFGDGRTVGDDDKIPEPTGTSGDGIRSIVKDDNLYTDKYSVALPATPVGTDWNLLLDAVTTASEHYMGSGNRTAFVSYKVAAKLLTIRDNFGHRIYRNLSEVAGDMDVNQVVRVPTELFPAQMLCIVVDLADYNFGTNRGGEITLFDDFDIDFNQYKYLIETYLSGALTLPHSAQVFSSTVPITFALQSLEGDGEESETPAENQA
jgi:HK97 family phage prohead protease